VERTKIWKWAPTGSDIKIGCAGEYRQQFKQPTEGSEIEFSTNFISPTAYLKHP
jgi:hypothetical protein